MLVREKEGQLKTTKFHFGKKHLLAFQITIETFKLEVLNSLLNVTVGKPSLDGAQKVGVNWVTLSSNTVLTR